VEEWKDEHFIIIDAMFFWTKTSSTRTNTSCFSFVAEYVFFGQIFSMLSFY